MASRNRRMPGVALGLTEAEVVADPRHEEVLWLADTEPERRAARRGPGARRHRSGTRRSALLAGVQHGGTLGLAEAKVAAGAL
eukprot:6756074-Alexandrium_andersonii.AAC.1